MKRKLLGLAFIGALTLVLGGSIVGTILAQQNQSPRIDVQIAGDDTVVARVSDLPIRQGVVRRVSETRRSHDGTLTNDASEKAALVPLVGRKALVAEAVRRELEPSDSDVTAFIARHQTDCDAAGAGCRSAIIGMGFTYDEYWTVAAPDFKEELTIIRLHADNYQKTGVGDSATDAEIWAAREALGAEALNAATIVWEDQRLRDLYEEAIAEE